MGLEGIVVWRGDRDYGLVHYRWEGQGGRRFLKRELMYVCMYVCTGTGMGRGMETRFSCIRNVAELGRIADGGEDLFFLDWEE